jgi:hypothetical protein
LQRGNCRFAFFQFSVFSIQITYDDEVKCRCERWRSSGVVSPGWNVRAQANPVRLLLDGGSALNFQRSPAFSSRRKADVAVYRRWKTG